MIGLKIRVTDKTKLTILPAERRRVAITLLPAMPGSGGLFAITGSGAGSVVIRGAGTGTITVLAAVTGTGAGVVSITGNGTGTISTTPTISGTPPDMIIGAPYSFQYTVSPVGGAVTFDTTSAAFFAAHSISHNGTGLLTSASVT